MAKARAKKVIKVPSVPNTMVSFRESRLLTLEWSSRSVVFVDPIVLAGLHQADVSWGARVEMGNVRQGSIT